MIQRIQSLYLFAALVLVALCFFLPVATISVPGVKLDSFLTYLFNLKGFRLTDFNSTELADKPWSVIVTGLLLCCLYLFVIFSYKNRILQMRLCVYTIVFSVVLTIMLYWILNQVKNELSGEVLYHIAFVFPIIAGILSVLAFFAIRKDDKMVKSYDRLR